MGISVELLWAMIGCLGFLFVNEHFTSKKLREKLIREVHIKYITSTIVEQLLNDLTDVDLEIQRLQRANKKHEQQTNQEEESARGLGA